MNLTEPCDIDDDVFTELAGSVLTDVQSSDKLRDLIDLSGSDVDEDVDSTDSEWLDPFVQDDVWSFQIHRGKKGVLLN